ncbi:leucine-rich repeat-containing protein 15 [Caerostris extrusa]|uniref:Leucine-rich repeat-containing protein 15 n=1 Tax=Caerostris extrusa TaxID=172846 RepID=A0AAV4R122_CAEEX|nr:leucine-rich repeat-containing protein 15 [Caerostris extrusa]
MEGAFIEMINLEQLNLRDNRLPQLTTHSFVGLHKIQYLNLDANNISTIEVGTFQYLTNLAHLIISNNPLTTLSRLDFFGSRLQYIDISHVGLDRVPQSLTKFVRDLRLAKNNLTHISAGDFDSYPYLGLLVLDDNCVSEIENDALGRQEYLMRLWLNGNCLTKVPPNLPPSLLALYMEENKLTSLANYSFRGLVHLEQLFLQRNEIQDLFPCAFCDLREILKLKALLLLEVTTVPAATPLIENNTVTQQVATIFQNISFVTPTTDTYNESTKKEIIVGKNSIYPSTYYRSTFNKTREYFEINHLLTGHGLSITIENEKYPDDNIINYSATIA